MISKTKYQHIPWLQIILIFCSSFECSNFWTVSWSFLFSEYQRDLRLIILFFHELANIVFKLGGQLPSFFLENVVKPNNFILRLIRNQTIPHKPSYSHKWASNPLADMLNWQIVHQIYNLFTALISCQSKSSFGLRVCNLGVDTWLY